METGYEGCDCDGDYVERTRKDNVGSDGCLDGQLPMLSKDAACPSSRDGGCPSIHALSFNQTLETNIFLQHSKLSKSTYKSMLTKYESYDTSTIYLKL